MNPFKMRKILSVRYSFNLHLFLTHELSVATFCSYTPYLPFSATMARSSEFGLPTEHTSYDASSPPCFSLLPIHGSLFPYPVNTNIHYNNNNNKLTLKTKQTFSLLTSTIYSYQHNEDRLHINHRYV